MRTMPLVNLFFLNSTPVSTIKVYLTAYSSYQRKLARLHRPNRLPTLPPCTPSVSFSRAPPNSLSVCFAYVLFASLRW